MMKTLRSLVAAGLITSALPLSGPAMAQTSYAANDRGGNVLNFAARFFGGLVHPFHIMEGLINGTGNPQPVSVDSSGNVNVNVVSGGGGGGGGGAITAASGSYSSGALALGAIVDLGTGASPGANTTNGWLKSIATTLGSPFQAGGSIGNTTFASTQSGTWNLNNITGTISLPTGAATAALQTTANTSLATIASAATGPIPAQSGAGVDIGAVEAKALTTGGATPYHLISAASTNSTLVSTGPHTLYSLTLTGLNTTVGYVRIYDAASAPTCSSATGAVHTYPVIGAPTALGGLIIPLPAQGEALANGFAFCVTGGSADTDNTAGPAGILINATYK